jgi:glycosyltransferase involved in cell wall biosynthesis
MRILMLSQFYPPVVGGQERHVRTLSTALAARGHHVDVLTLASEPGDVGVDSEDGVFVHRVRSSAQRIPALYREASRPHALPVPDSALMRSVSALLEGTVHYDVLHAHDWAVNSALLPARRSGTPVVLSMHEYSHLCPTKRLMRGQELCAGPELIACLRCTRREHRSILGPGVAAANLVARLWRQRAVATFLPVSSAVAVGTRLPPGTFEIIPNFIPDQIVTRRPTTRTEGPIAYVGDVSWDKGVHVLLEAHNMLDGAPRLVLAGRSCEGGTLRLTPNAELVGVLDPADVRNLMTSASVVVVPSIVPDSCPTVILEAMAAGRPVIASARGGIVDLVVDGRTGYLVEPGNPQALATALAKLLSDPTLARQMGHAALERVSQFTVSAVVARIEAVYERVAAQPKGATATMSSTGHR